MNKIIDMQALNIEDDWPLLVALDGIENLPPLPQDILPTWAQQFERELTASTENNPELAIANILGCCATAAARTHKISPDGQRLQPLCLWLLTALESGSRKSEALERAKEPLDIWEVEQGKALEADIALNSVNIELFQNRLNELKKKAAKAKGEEFDEFKNEISALVLDMPEEIEKPELYTNDATVEKVPKLMQVNNGCLAWLSDEGAFFDIVAGIYSGGNANTQALLQAQSGNRIKINRVNKDSSKVYVDDPALTVCISLQPDLLEGIAHKNRKIHSNGLLYRFIWFWPQSTIGYRPRANKQLNQSTIDLYRVNLTAMLNAPMALNKDGEPCKHVIQLSDEAREVYFKFGEIMERESRPDGKYYNYKGWASKAPDTALRVAGVLHCMRYAQEIPHNYQVAQETMNKAIEFITISSFHMIESFRVMGGDSEINLALSLWQWIENPHRKNRKKAFTVSELQQNIKGKTDFKKVQAIYDSLDILKERGYIKVISSEANGQGRKKSPLVIVRPELCKDW